MNPRRWHPHKILLTITLVALFVGIGTSSDDGPFLGFDRNDYPGDENLNELHKTFAFSAYWLNNPPGKTANSWRGTRAKVDAAGFGFLVLFNGRLDRELGVNATGRGVSDGQAAVTAAKREGFPAQTVIFLDQEEGGRMLPEQKAYLYAWVDGVIRGGYRAGIYCSGIAFREQSGATVVTAEDIKANAGGRTISFWIANDGCPPSPGCVTATRPSLKDSKIDFAEIWQFAQSPRRKDVSGKCPGYEDGSCYSSAGGKKLDVDMDVATAADPSHGRGPGR